MNGDTLRTGKSLPIPSECPDHLFPQGKNKKWKIVKGHHTREAINQRPSFDQDRFVTLWHDQHSAEIALEIRKAMILTFCRGMDFMLYPSDPMLLLGAWVGDSLDTKEFVMRVEDFLHVSISDRDLERFIYQMTYREAVQFIMELQKQNFSHDSKK